MATVFYQTSPAYGSPAAWCESNLAVGHVIQLHQTQLKAAVELAHKIRRGMEALFPIMDELCLLTCAMCPDRCCLVATVWIDFRDLLFLHLNELPIPPAQLIGNLGEDCRYYSHRGCLLPRCLRPWACTVYLCGAQVKILRKMPSTVQKDFAHHVGSIKEQRLAMEAEFIRVIT
jgi:hypothetical protein